MNWNIKGNIGKCTECKKDFNENDSFISSIEYSEEGFSRGDCCMNCWGEIEEKRSFYYWKSVFKPAGKKKVFVDDAVLMDFLTRLEEEDNEQKVNFKYLLSLILMRKKLLKFEDVFKEGDKEYLILADKEGREFRVLNPNMDNDTIETVKEQMVSVLNRDFFGEDDSPEEE